MTHTSISTRWCVAAAAIVLAVALPGTASGASTTSEATRLREFRHMIVGLYRVPGPAAPSGEDPLFTLWRSLATQYDVLLGVSA
jgi:hypothetical protein